METLLIFPLAFHEKCIKAKWLDCYLHQEEQRPERTTMLHHTYTVCLLTLLIHADNGKAIPLQAWTGPEGSRRLRLPDFKTIGT